MKRKICVPVWLWLLFLASIFLLMAALQIERARAAPRKGHAAHVTYHALTLQMARVHQLRPTRYMGTIRGYPVGATVRICGVETRACIRVLVVDVWNRDDGVARHVDYDLNAAAHNAICPFTTKEPYWKCHARRGMNE